MNINSSATLNISENAGVDKSTSIGMMHNLFVGGNSVMNVTGELHEIVKGNKTSEAKKKTTINEEHELNVEKTKKVNVKDSMHLNSGTKTNFF